jgi:hypothetical protein
MTFSPWPTITGAAAGVITPPVREGEGRLRLSDLLHRLPLVLHTN